jgi:hypothetical protein
MQLDLPWLAIMWQLTHPTPHFWYWKDKKKKKKKNEFTGRMDDLYDAMRCDAMQCNAMRCDAMRCDELYQYHTTVDAFAAVLITNRTSSGLQIS